MFNNIRFNQKFSLPVRIKRRPWSRWEYAVAYRWKSEAYTYHVDADVREQFISDMKALIDLPFDNPFYDVGFWNVRTNAEDECIFQPYRMQRISDARASLCGEPVVLYDRDLMKMDASQALKTMTLQQLLHLLEDTLFPFESTMNNREADSNE